MKIGSYDLVKQIGEGAFGRTYLAKHSKLGVPVCLKQEKTGNASFKRLFEEEARALARLHHESLPSFMDYYDDPDPSIGQMIVMSFVAGKSLAQFVEEGGPVADEHVCWILQRLLKVLGYMHYHGVVHCDIKPDNILLQLKEHNAVLVDFGLVADRPTGRTTPKGGTEHYLPPEFLAGMAPRPESDLYSLGKVGVFLLGGHVGAGSIPADVHPRLRAFLLPLIRQDAGARPTHAMALHDELIALRQAMFGRASTTDIFRYRSGTIVNS